MSLVKKTVRRVRRANTYLHIYRLSIFLYFGKKEVGWGVGGADISSLARQTGCPVPIFPAHTSHLEHHHLIWDHDDPSYPLNTPKNLHSRNWSSCYVYKTTAGGTFSLSARKKTIHIWLTAIASSWSHWRPEILLSRMNIISLFLWSQCTVFKLNNERLMMKKLTTVQRMTMPMTMRATAKVRQGSSKPVGWSVLATCLVSSTSFRWTRSWWRRRRRGTEGAEVRGMVDNLINIAKGTSDHALTTVTSC